MKFVLAALGACALLIGCGGGDDGDIQPLSTTTIDEGEGTTKKPEPGPVEYKSLIRRPKVNPLVMGTNKLYRLNNFSQSTNRFTGITKNVSTDGLVTSFRIEHGLKDVYAATLFQNSTNQF